MNSSTLELLLPPQLVQCIVLHLPEFKSKLPKFQSSSLKNSHLECSIVVEPKHQHYLVVSSRLVFLIVLVSFTIFLFF